MRMPSTVEGLESALRIRAALPLLGVVCGTARRVVPVRVGFVAFTTCDPRACCRRPGARLVRCRRSPSCLLLSLGAIAVRTRGARLAVMPAKAKARFIDPMLLLRTDSLPTDAADRSSSLADTPRRKGRANISAPFWSATTRFAISYSREKSAPDLQRNHWARCTRNSAPRNVPTVRLSICHQSKMANGCRTSRLR